ncbi:Uncharacterized protein APZ42_019687 [Daphnia magna]|uniref:Uncharacterized protein n=1 Tax=Daphnia magna TaxID=35525 RepID=A0A164YBE2_9CRUS|nr:Uncharacterized protein APZ42_019687 [Daphnia magna]
MLMTAGWRLNPRGWCKPRTSVILLCPGLPILLKIHDFVSEFNENHENLVYFSIGHIVFELNVKNHN